MNYKDDAKETQRRWMVKNGPLDTRLQLQIGDQLAFSGDGIGTPTDTIIRRRSGAADITWGHNCLFTAVGTDGKVEGIHTPSGEPFEIIFTTVGSKRVYSGTVAFPLAPGSATWMADEGP